MFIISTIFLRFIWLCTADKITIVSPERPVIVYTNPKYIVNVSVTSRRYVRRAPIYYLSGHYTALVGYDNNVSVSFFYYEYLTNKYQRSFIELHYKVCDLIHKDKLFGTMVKQGKLAKPCPYPPGDYSLYNMTVPQEYIPRGFPFRKGRVYANVTVTATREPVANGYTDIEIKEINVNKKTG